MLDHPDFVPFIRTWEWPGVVDCHTQPLVADDPRLVVAYGTRGLRDNTYLTSAGMQALGGDHYQVHRAAIAHLRDQHVPAWSVDYVGNLAIATRTGDEMVAADLLDPESMCELTSFFASEVVYIGIPTQFTMVACVHPLALGGIVAALHQEAIAARAGALSPQPLILSRGELVGSVLNQHLRAGASGFQQLEELSHALGNGLASVAHLVDRAKNITGSSSVATFAPCFSRHLGSCDGELAQLAETALNEFASAYARLARARHLIDHLEIMAGALQSNLAEGDYVRLARAVLATATTMSRAGTGFWGIGRALPQRLRLTLNVLSGVLGIAAGPPRGATRA